MTQNITTKVGTKGTVHLYSDHLAVTVTEVISAKQVRVSFNKTICKDYYAGDYEILNDLEGNVSILFTLRKNGQWIKKGQGVKHGVRLTLGNQYHYIDPGF